MSLSANLLEPASPISEKPALHGELQTRIHSLGPWFHNIDLCGVETAPDHPFGDFPGFKWQKLSAALPDDLNGASVLDIGCNAGFYSFAMKQRNAGRVLGIDLEDRCLAQAKFAAETLGMEIEFRKMSLYDVDTLPEQFDYVLFMGVFYHLRYPLLALDKAVKKTSAKLIFQSMIRGSRADYESQADYPFDEEQIFADPDFPAAYFIEKSYASDYTNWFIPNRSGVMAMLRSSGLDVACTSDEETFICTPTNARRGNKYILDMELDGTI